MADGRGNNNDAGDHLDFKCYYCNASSKSFSDIIGHTNICHSKDQLALRVRCLNTDTGKVGYQTKIWNVIPAYERAEGKIIIPNEAERKLRIIKDPETASPEAKKSKQESEKEGEENKDQCRKTLFSSDESNETFRQLISEMETLLPTVLDNLQDTGRTETFHNFFQLVRENRFPLKNIAWLLFLDVVDFFSCTNTSGMCYKDPRTVRFWKIGYKLMHGKLLRFFGGSKHQGQVVSGRSEKGLYSSEDAVINFAVPDLKTLQKFESSIDLKAVKPGILVEMVEKFKSETDELRKTYKICVDGKKINGCSDVPEGQINLFGYEGSPTVNERMARLEKEKELLNSFVLYLNELDVKRKEGFTCLNSDDHGKLISFVKNIILLLSCRLKDVREARSKRERALAKFKILGGSDWRKSKYGYIISHIQVWLYRASSSMKSIFRLTDKLCRAGAAANSSLDLFHTSQVDLGKQENYICLQTTLSCKQLTHGR